MVKVGLSDTYPGFSLEIDGVIINKGDTIDIPDSPMLTKSLDEGIIEKFEERSKTSAKPKLGKDVWVFAEQRAGNIPSVVFELLSKAKELSTDLNAKVAAVLLCSKDDGMSGQLIEHLADKVYLVEDKFLADYRTDLYAKVIVDLIKKHEPQIVLYGATHIGRDLAPRIAQRIDTGLTADCTGLDIDDDGLLIQTRPAFGGNLMAQIKCPDHKPQMSTARPGVFKIIEDKDNKGEIIKEKISLKKEDSLIEIVEVIKGRKKQVNLEKADIIISAGRGLCSSENLGLVKELARLMGAEVGASRAVVDAGWIPKDHQVGQTGKTVSPKLYIACGISVAIQHRAGMQGSDTIIAINKDPKAMIFQVADYGIVADAKQFLQALIDELKVE